MVDNDASAVAFLIFPNNDQLTEAVRIIMEIKYSLDL